MAKKPESRFDAALASWAFGFVLITLGLAAALISLRVAWEVTLAWTLLSWGTLVAMEPGLIAAAWWAIAPERGKKSSTKGDSEQSPPPEEPDSPSAPSSMRVAAGTSPEPEWSYDVYFRRAKVRRIVELCIILALAVLAFLNSRVMWQPPPPSLVSTVKLSDQDEAALRKCLDKVCGQPNDGGQNGSQSNGTQSNGTQSNGTLRINPALEDALIRYLNDTSHRDRSGSNSFSWGTVSISVVLLILAGIVLLAWVVRKRPSTAAPLGAAGLAAAAIKNAEHLSRLDWAGLLFVLILFAIAVLALLFLCFLQRGASHADTDKAGKGGPEGEKKLVESPLNITFSLAVLLWAAIVVGYHANPSKELPVNPFLAPGQTISARLLPSLIGFKAYSADVSDLRKGKRDPVSTLASEASADAKTNDLLLLLGSADCTAIRKSNQKTNQKLAQERAAAVQEVLQNQLINSVRVDARSLHQQETCSKSEDLRAVFPVLIQAKNTQ